jgi:NAD(P)-dependent dehydrogenase (short-subunit alcohol dehydrogenase family)
MPTGPKGEKRPADVIGNAVKVMRIATVRSRRTTARKIPKTRYYVKGVLFGVAAALPVFRRQGFGHFINIVSTAGLRVAPQGVYAATKNAMRTLTEALRQEAGARLRVTGISPGFVHTELASSV